MGYPLSKVQEIAAKAQALQPPPAEKRELNKSEVIKELSGEIASLQKKGFSLEAIAQFLNGEGVEISSSTLKSYLQRSKVAPKTKKKKPAAGSATKATAVQSTKASKSPIVQTKVETKPETKPERKGTFEMTDDTPDI